MTTQTLPDGRVITFSYDPNGNVTSITPPGRPRHLFSYTPVDLDASYDPPSPLGGEGGGEGVSTRYSYNLDKQLTKITRPDGQAVDLSYDSGGRLFSVTPSPLGGGGLGGGISYSYNPTTGALETVTAPDGGTLNYTWGPRGGRSLINKKVLHGWERGPAGGT